MEPVHPEDMEETWASIVLILILYSVLFAALGLGHWDWLVAHAVEWFPTWHWGG